MDDRSQASLLHNCHLSGSVIFFTKTAKVRTQIRLFKRWQILSRNFQIGKNSGLFRLKESVKHTQKLVYKVFLSLPACLLLSHTFLTFMFAVVYASNYILPAVPSSLRLFADGLLENKKKFGANPNSVPQDWKNLLNRFSFIHPLRWRFAMHLLKEGTECAHTLKAAYIRDTSQRHIAVEQYICRLFETVGVNQLIKGCVQILIYYLRQIRAVGRHHRTYPVAVKFGIGVNLVFFEQWK